MRVLSGAWSLTISQGRDMVWGLANVHPQDGYLDGGPQLLDPLPVPHHPVVSPAAYFKTST